MNWLNRLKTIQEATPEKIQSCLISPPFELTELTKVSLPEIATADTYTDHGCKYYPKICKDRYSCHGLPCNRQEHFLKNQLPYN